MKLAHGLLRRKELEKKVKQLEQIKDRDIFEVKYQRRAINENVDDLQASVPKMTAAQVTEEYDFYSHRLRLLDGAIQQANWTTEIDVEDKVWNNYDHKKAE